MGQCLGFFQVKFNFSSLCYILPHENSSDNLA